MRTLRAFLKKLNPFKFSIKKLIKQSEDKSTANKSTSRTDLILPGLRLIYARTTDTDIPHEVHVIVPRAEIRKTYNRETGEYEFELIYSSLTIVDAPHHPLAGHSPPPYIPPQ
jgi:hypothetical protein